MTSLSHKKPIKSRKAQHPQALTSTVHKRQKYCNNTARASAQDLSGKRRILGPCLARQVGACSVHTPGGAEAGRVSVHHLNPSSGKAAWAAGRDSAISMASPVFSPPCSPLQAGGAPLLSPGLPLVSSRGKTPSRRVASCRIYFCKIRNRSCSMVRNLKSRAENLASSLCPFP